jgi:hypothetical protein
MSDSAPQWLADAVRVFGETTKAKLAGPGDREANIRQPLENLLRAAGVGIGVKAEFFDEVRDTDRQVRPDYGVAVGRAMTGYVEVKAPGRGIDPAGFTGHDLVQWERQRDLPNLLYTNGTEWRLYRDGEALGEPVSLSGGALDKAGSALTAPPMLATMLTDFLRWKPAPITSVSSLVRAIAPLTRLLRGEVLDQLAEERRAIKAGADQYQQPFLGIARDWRSLLFPEADDKTFADGYAQAVTFALLLARTEGIDVAGTPLHEVGAQLQAGHSLMGRALQVLTDDVEADFKVTLDLLVRIVGAVQWERVRAGRRDMYLHLYEHFLEEYDNELRKQSGTYYTPREVVDEMVRLAEEALVTRLGKTTGFRDESVNVVDPAMGTGTYLLEIVDRVADAVATQDGPGMVPGELEQLARRLIGFELQMGPFAVAELRTADLLASHGVARDDARARLYVTNTLDDPYVEQTQLAFALQSIAESRRQANAVKTKADVTVVIGNPPYRERAESKGGWVESGGSHSEHVILDDFREPDNGRVEYVLKNLYVYFWRWATWKVWESTPQDPDGDGGIVCFISTAGYLKGPGFKGMRRYLRAWASEGWVIDLTPEGQTPDVPTRIFPGVRQPLAIGLFVRTPGKTADLPAAIHTRAVTGRQTEKFAALAAITLDDAGWQLARADWASPFTPAAAGDWDSHPALGDLMPWVSPGAKMNRTWVYAPDPDTLLARWRALTSEQDQQRKAALLKETRDRTLLSSPAPLPEFQNTSVLPLAKETSSRAAPVARIGYRAFDRQWVIADSRALDRPRPELWAAQVPGQVFVVEQHSKPLADGPGLIFTSLIPDMDHFKGSEGGRALPFLHADGTPNFAVGLVDALCSVLGIPVAPEDVLAYIAATVAHPRYTTTFAEELHTPGIRMPITDDTEKWSRAVALGREVLWLHTYGARFSGAGRPADDIRLPASDPERPLSITPIRTMPATMSYDEPTRTLRLGDGTFGPVSPEVWDYAVGGRNVLKSWFNYRKAEPGGRRSSPLDDIVATSWDPQWSAELLDLLTVLLRLTRLEPEQADVLESILAGSVLSSADLAARGVRWPKTKADRAPRRSAGPTALF